MKSNAVIAHLLGIPRMIQSNATNNYIAVDEYCLFRAQTGYNADKKKAAPLVRADGVRFIGPAL